MTEHERNSSDTGVAGLFADRLSGLTGPDTLDRLWKADRLVVIGCGFIVLVLMVASFSGVMGGASLWIAVLAMVLIFGLMVFVYWRGERLRPIEDRIRDRGVAARLANGHWWQIVPDTSHSGLAYLSIRLSAIPGEHSIYGVALDREGKTTARFSSDTVAVGTTCPIRFHYVWRGAVLTPDTADIHSGVGWMRFDSHGSDDLPTEGEGMYTAGDPREMGFGPPRVVELIRFSAREAERIEQEPHCLPELAREAYERFRIRAGGVMTP